MNLRGTGFESGRQSDESFTTINQDGQTIVMVTHSVKAASSAKRVLLSRTEKYSISFTGDLTNEEMYERISDTLKILTTGGEEDE